MDPKEIKTTPEVKATAIATPETPKASETAPKEPARDYIKELEAAKQEKARIELEAINKELEAFKVSDPKVLAQKQSGVERPA
jgi:hypothetical protein